MKLFAFAIFDNKADSFNTPFFYAARGQAVRAFADLANDPQSTVSKHPEDFKLVCIGEYNDATGKLDGYATFESLGFAHEYTKQNGTVIGLAKGNA